MNENMHYLLLILIPLLIIKKTETSFILKKFQNKEFSAGILPLIHSQGQYYFLLGKEDCKDGYYSDGSYSDFGGSSDPADNQEWQKTALREFEEELGFKTQKKDTQFDSNSLIQINNQWITVIKNELWERILSIDNLRMNNHVFNQEKSYYMILLEIDRQRLNDQCFKTALTLRDGEKSTIALFPASQFLNWIDNLDTNNSKKSYSYTIMEKKSANETNVKTEITYVIRASFAKSLQLLLKTSTALQTIQNNRASDQLTIEIIDTGKDEKKTVNDTTLPKKPVKQKDKKKTDRISGTLCNYIPMFIFLFLAGVTIGAYCEYNNLLKSSGAAT